jgi:hypothetical protein
LLDQMAAKTWAKMSLRLLIQYKSTKMLAVVFREGEGY